MAEKKKSKTVDDIVNDYQKFHHKAGKKFKDRIKKFEEFHDPESIHGIQLAHHAHYTLFGKPGDKDFPGAYNKAHQVVDKHFESDDTKIKDQDKLTEILETYVDSFLEKAMGSKFKEIIEHAKKDGTDDKQLRLLKGQLMGQYHTDKNGRPINILTDEYISQLKDKKKVFVIEHLKGLSSEVRKDYTSRLQQQALEGLFSEDDRVDMAKYITPLFKKRGWKHDRSHVTFSTDEQSQLYSLLLDGNSEQLKKVGYKIIKPEEKKK